MTSLAPWRDRRGTFSLKHSYVTSEREKKRPKNKKINEEMVLGLLSIASIPTVTGVSLGISENRKRNHRQNDENRMAKIYMDVYCDGQSKIAQMLNGRRVVLRNNKVPAL